MGESHRGNWGWDGGGNTFMQIKHQVQGLWGSSVFAGWDSRGGYRMMKAQSALLVYQTIIGSSIGKNKGFSQKGIEKKVIVNRGF